MPAESKTAAATSPKSRPTTRTSIRQSLNLASMSKALVDVMSKDTTKNPKKPKASSTRRSSTLGLQPPPPTALAPPRTSMGEVRPPSQVAKRTETPESRTITRRRVSGSYTRSSSEEQQQNAHKITAHEPATPQSGVQKPNSVLRSKNGISTTSALPKYRPKTNANDPPAQKPPSPVRAGTRRRLSSSDDEKKEQNCALSPLDKGCRPISPLPNRALKTNVNSINVTSPPVTPTKAKTIVSPSSGSRLSPVRPTKIVKTGTANARPPSSTSSVSSLQPPNTPKSAKRLTPTATENKSKLGAFSRSGNNVKKSGGTPSSSLHSSVTRESPSPLSRHSRQSSKTTQSPMASGNMSHISEGLNESEDSDLEDVELLLAPVAAMGAPTPAMPRIQVLKRRGNPQTPTKSGLPSRQDMSYVSPEPPSSDKKHSSLRPPVHNDAPRGSILSWEQLAAEASRTMGEDEFGRMLADVPAPFRSGAASPALSSHIGLPDSPGLSAIDSPSGGYGSISQVLLPEVTPSPAVNHVQHSKFHFTPDASKSAVDSSTSTLLRLQLASMENTAKERLRQLQAMEEEIHNIKQAHAQQMEEMQKQVHYMETQSRLNDDRVSAMFQASLEGQLRQQRVAQEEGFRKTMSQFQDTANLMHSRALDSERAKMAAASSAGLAAFKWGTVASVCEAELDHVRTDRAMLAFLVAQVDQMSMALNS